MPLAFCTLKGSIRRSVRDIKSGIVDIREGHVMEIETEPNPVDRTWIESGFESPNLRSATGLVHSMLRMQLS